METAKLVLGKLVRGDAFPGRVAAYLTDQGEQARQRVAETRDSDTGALFEFSDYVSRLGQGDQRLRILQEVQNGHPTPLPSDSTDPYLPGPEQRRWIALYGWTSRRRK